MVDIHVELAQHVASQNALLARRMLHAVAKHPDATTGLRNAARDAEGLTKGIPETDADAAALRSAATVIAGATAKLGAGDGYLPTRYLACAGRSLEEAIAMMEIALGRRRP